MYGHQNRVTKALKTFISCRYHWKMGLPSSIGCWEAVGNLLVLEQDE